MNMREINQDGIKIGLCVLFITLILFFGVTAAGAVQDIPAGAPDTSETGITIATQKTVTGSAGPEKPVFFTLPDLIYGQHITIDASVLTGDLDPVIGITDYPVGRGDLITDIFTEYEKQVNTGENYLLAMKAAANTVFLQWDDDSGFGYASSLIFDVPKSGTYYLVLFSNPLTKGSGTFQINVHEELTDTADRVPPVSQTDIIVLNRYLSHAAPAVEVVQEVITDDEVLHSLEPVTAGNTLYFYLAPKGGDVSPLLILNDYAGKPIAVSRQPDGTRPATLTVPVTSDQTGLYLTIRPDPRVQPYKGNVSYELIGGINDPGVLSGSVAEYGPHVFLTAVPVKIGLTIDQITSVNQIEENYGAVGTLVMHWNDPALSFSPDTCNCAYKILPFEDFLSYTSKNEISWPDFIFYNQQEKRWSQNQKVFISSNGTAVYYERFWTLFQAPNFKFQKFPFDTQTFHARITNLYPESMYYYELLPGYSGMGTELGEEQWEIIGTSVAITNRTEEIVDVRPRSEFVFTYDAKRHLTYYIFRIFFPLLFIVLISWVPFFLRDYTYRIQTAGANLLLFITFNFTISNDLPRLGYMTVMDWVIVSTFFVTGLTIVINVYLKLLESRGQEDLAFRIDKYLNWIYPLIYLIAIINIVVLIV